MSWANTPTGWAGAVLTWCLLAVYMYYHSISGAIDAGNWIRYGVLAICTPVIGNFLFQRLEFRYRQHPQESLFILGIMLLRGIADYAVKLSFGFPYFLLQLLLNTFFGVLVVDAYFEHPQKLQRWAIIGTIGGACIGIVIALMNPVVSYGSLWAESLPLKILLSVLVGMVWCGYGLTTFMALWLTPRNKAATIPTSSQDPTDPTPDTETPVPAPALHSEVITGVLSFKGYEYVIIGGVELRTDRKQQHDLKIGMTYRAEYQGNDRRLIEVERIVNTPPSLTFGDKSRE